jgi:hypothetical protein
MFKVMHIIQIVLQTLRHKRFHKRIAYQRD